MEPASHSLDIPPDLALIADRLAGLLVAAANLTAFKATAYYNAASCIFETATDSSLELVKAVEPLARQIYRQGVKFKKAGVVLSGLVLQNQVQRTLFDDTAIRQRDSRLMATLDRLNAGGKQVYFAAEGMEKPWQTQFNHRSACYTTRWDELVQVG